MSREVHPTPCSPQKPLAPEARPKFVGTGLPAKPVLLRSAPKPVAPTPLAKAPRPPTKPVAAPILAQGRASPESSECPLPAGGPPTSQGGAGRAVSPVPPCPCRSFARPRAGPVLDPQLGALPAAHAADQGHRQAAPAATPGRPARGLQVSLASPALQPSRRRPPHGPVQPPPMCPSAGFAAPPAQQLLGSESIHTSGPDEPPGQREARTAL